MKSKAGRPVALWVIAAFVATLGVYCACARIGTAVCGNDDPREVVYNRMIRGFSEGHLYLDREVPIGFAMLQDPYDPEQNAPYRAPPYFLYDLSYYRGKLYAYFGPVPALLLFGPYHLITGEYLSYKEAAVGYCALGLAATGWLLLSARRRYAPETPEWIVAIVLLTVGLSSGLPTLLARVDIWEIPIAGVTAMILCVIAALWQSWHSPSSRALWLAAASLGIGLAVGTRPTAILIAPVLVLPLVREWRQHRFARVGSILAGAALPLALLVGALGAYNEARFGNPLEFGQTYQLAALQYVGKLRQYGLDYAWDNFRIYFLNFTPWTTRFPFIAATPKIALHPGHAQPEFCFGILGNVPIVILAFGALLVWKRKDGLRFITGVILWIAVAQTGLLMLFFGAVSRYEVEILTPLLCLAAIGLLAVEAGRKGRIAIRSVWIALALVSVVFNLGEAAIHADWTRKKASYWFMSLNQPKAAVEDYSILILLEPPAADLHNAKGVALGMVARWNEAIPEFEKAIRLQPGNADEECNLGTALLEIRDPAAAVSHLEASLRLRPGDPRTQDALARAQQQVAASGGSKDR